MPKSALKRPFRIGLTGSIGMGKTTTAKMFGRLHIPVYHADAAVHALYAKGGAAVAKIARAFPGAVKGAKVDRKALSRIVGKDKRALKRLENIVHPLVARERRKFVSDAARKGARFVVLDIPLLFETGGEKSVDAVVVVSAPRHVQRKRVMEREGMTAQKFAQLHARQVPDAKKRAKADFVIETDRGLPHAFAGVKRVVAALKSATGKETQDTLMREIVLDTETTGLDPASGHRILEICALELDIHLPTGRVFHKLVHPERDIPEESTRIHGHTLESLAGQPVFAAIVDELVEFLGDAPLVIHNAEFDIKFLNAEFTKLGHNPIPLSRGIDTIMLAKRRFPGARYSLDELCRRFSIDLSGRAKHGARIDTELLAQVYLELLGGRQSRLALAPGDTGSRETVTAELRVARSRPEALAPRLSAAEREAHARFVAAELEGDVLWSWAR